MISILCAFAPERLSVSFLVLFHAKARRKGANKKDGPERLIGEAQGNEWQRD
jgi:hypothetical protein